MRTIRGYRDGLRNILDQASVLNCQQNTDNILSKVLEQVAEIFPSKNSFVYFDLSMIRDQNFTGSGWNDLQLFKGTGNFSQSAQTAVNYFQSYSFSDQQTAVITEEKLLITPLFADHHQQYGILAVQYQDILRNEDSQLFEVYAKQVGIIISNLLLRSMLQAQNQELRDTYATLRKNYMETIDVMRQIVDAKDFYTRGHSDRVSFYAVMIARAMGKDESYLERLRIAGLFHDIGKIGIPDGILQKNGKLTDEEYAQIKQHPSLGRKILAYISSFSNMLPIIEAHHERQDGYGYPFGLHGAEIPEEARIISIADSFDAMTSKRVYRDSLSLPKAISELVNGKNTQFDAQIVDVFLKILETPEKLEQQLAEAFPADAVLFKKG